MINQRLKRYLPLVLGHRTVYRFIPSLMLLCIIMGLPALSGAQQVCQPDGDVDRNGSVTAADALLAFQQALGLTQLTACQRDIADVTPLPSAPDGNITASDALCIFQKALSLPSCLDTLPSTNQPPVADAGEEQFVFGNEIVTLSGLGSSDADGTVVSYHWTQTSGPPVAFSGANTPNASFIAPEVAFENLLEELEFQLTVTDDDGASDTAVVLVVAIYDPGTNEPPTANAGFDQMVSENILVTLSGAASDSDGTVTDYFWLQISGVQVLLFDADTFNPSFTAPEVDSEAELVFELNVLDDELGFAMDTVTITVLNAVSNTPPVADAGRGQTVDENTLVTLSGSGSDADGTIVGYHWTQTSGTPVVLTGANSRTASFTAPDVDADEELVFQLTVTDDGGASDVDTVTVTIRAAPASALRAEYFENPAPGKPNYVMAGNNASLQYWTDPDGTVGQAVYESADGAHRVRVFYDEETELPRAVLDEISGNWLSIREYGTNRIDFWAFDSDGSYQSGFAIYEEDGQYYMGEIVGVPVHEGREITGELSPSSASWTGSFTLEGDNEDGLTNIQALSEDQVMFLESLELSGASSVNANSPVVAAFTLRTGLFWGGMAVGVIAAIPSAPLWMPLAAGGLLATSLFLPDIKDVVRGAAREIGCESFDEGPCSLVGVHLADPDSRGPIGLIRDLYDWMTKVPEELSEAVRQRVDSARQYYGNMKDRLSPGNLADYIFPVAHAKPPDSDDAPSPGSSILSGRADRDDGTEIDLDGTMDPNGSYRATGTDSQSRRVSIIGSVDDDGTNAGGTFEWGEEQGDIPREFPPGIPYLLCSYAYIKSSSYSFGDTREFLGWSIVNGIPSATVRTTSNLTGRVETRTGSASCDVCTAEGTVTTLTGGARVETISCSQYQMAKDAYWSGFWHHPVPTAKFSCAETTTRC